MDIEKKLIGLLKDAAVIVHKYHYETNMPTKDVCAIIQILADNYVNNIEVLPEDEYSLKKQDEIEVEDEDDDQETVAKKASKAKSTDN